MCCLSCALLKRLQWNRWPELFFESTCGRWMGELERPAAGDYEVRPTLNGDEVST